MQRRLLSRDPGISLAEVLVSIVLIAVVFGAIATFIVGSLSSMRSGQDFQAATQLVNRNLEDVRAFSDDALRAGVNTTQVNTAIANSSDTRVVDDNGTLVYAPDGNLATAQDLITSNDADSITFQQPPQNIDGVDYVITTYLTRCYQPQANPGQCNPAGPGAPMTRVIVTADWTPPGESAKSTSAETLVYVPEDGA